MQWTFMKNDHALLASEAEIALRHLDGACRDMAQSTLGHSIPYKVALA